MGKGILIVGSLNMDIVVEMTKMPELGETVMGKHLSYIPGGKGGESGMCRWQIRWACDHAWVCWK